MSTVWKKKLSPKRAHKKETDGECNKGDCIGLIARKQKESISHTLRQRYSRVDGGVAVAFLTADLSEFSLTEFVLSEIDFRLCQHWKGSEIQLGNKPGSCRNCVRHVAQGGPRWELPVFWDHNFSLDCVGINGRHKNTETTSVLVSAATFIGE